MSTVPNLRMLAGFRFKRASARDVPRVLELRRSVYASDWPTVEDDAVVDDLDSRAVHFLAEDVAGVICAAFRMIPPNRRPFDIEHFIKIADFLPPKRIPAEVGRLCVRHKNRNVRSDAVVLLGLLKLAYDCARELRVTDLLLKASPRLRNLYRVAGFRPLGIILRHPSYGEEHVMRLDLVALQSNPEASAVTKYLVTAEPPAVRL